jgi:hypothetical protein
MSRWAIRFSLCTLGLLLATQSLRAANGSLGHADLVGKIAVVYKVDENIEKDPTVGFITVGKTKIRVTHDTSISKGSDLVYRAFGSLKKGATVEVVFIDATADDKTAKDINILKDPVVEKEGGRADKEEPDNVITAVTVVKPDPEKDDTIGYITVDGQEIRVSTNTRIIDGPGDLVHRGMGSLRKGCRVRVTMSLDGVIRDIDKPAGKPPAAKEILLLPGPAKKKGAKTVVGRTLFDAVMTRNSLNVEGVYSKIEGVTKATEDGDTVGTVEFPAYTIRITKTTAITGGPGGRLTRGFDDLKKGSTVEVVFVDSKGEDHTAKQVNILIRPELAEAVLKFLPPNKDPKAPELSVHVVGGVTSAKAADGEVVGVIHVEGVQTIFMAVGSADVAATTKTKIIKEDGKEGRFADITKGLAVAVVVTRAEAEAGESATRAKFIFLLDSPQADKDEPEKADVRGTITELNANDEDGKKSGTLGTLLVEGTKEKTTNYDTASVKITTKTKIFKQDGKERKAAKFEDLKKGAKVQIDFTRPVAKSDPAQATAATVVILD